MGVPYQPLNSCGNFSLTFQIGCTLFVELGDLLDLEERGHGYLIKVQGACLVVLKGQPAWEGCEFSHQCETWRRSRKFMAVREKEEELKGMATPMKEWLCSH